MEIRVIVGDCEQIRVLYKKPIQKSQYKKPITWTLDLSYPILPSTASSHITPAYHFDLSTTCRWALYTCSLNSLVPYIAPDA